MVIRQLKMEEFDVSTQLSEYAFRYKLTAEEKEQRRQHFVPEQYWGLFDDEELQAKLTLLPFQVYVNGKVFDMGGIAGVATWPENRRKGHVAQLLKHALQEMKNQGQSLSFLHPFLVPFYRKYGWEVFAEYKRYFIQAHQLPPRVEYEGKVVRDVTDIAVLDGLYQSFASRYNGTLVRDEAWWKRSVLNGDGHTAVYYSPEGEPQGYVLYENKDKELICDEFVYSNENARRALLTYFANHPSEQFKLSMLPSDDELPFLLPEPRVKQELVPYFMARIVDLRAFIAQYPFEANQSLDLVLQVEDSVASWNTGFWHLTINEDGQGNIELLSSDDKSTADVSGDIQSFTAMFMGYKRPRELYLMERLAGNPLRATQLDHVIPACRTFFMDFF
ncbi:GNAT family N-acetyltransferase [Paenibacillus urinalis]|uniref:GNAT family N-acetyltransferase n=1 Tax=Paenibacillus urinalis TaxID=521520 RepID=A0AAX3N0N7_9BACL|nr:MULTISPECIES: GNAT family N-acetyltransferase [Paenibacillus]WDH82192.1 GNAT family N-acetyltransferase [Paenibacillus urinalis]WDH98242.1 GNAT family N-acetyltransferase [Paenibacillus urinalis]WDI01927.1 GNAT family N-acetyltransferase [Paenibacillus urinalis]GAK43098.1 putative N-acetyltransferase [Paenibacillus sp. TCA20]